MSVTPVLSAKDLTINYDNFPAVDNISFDVQEGDCGWELREGPFHCAEAGAAGR